MKLETISDEKLMQLFCQGKNDPYYEVIYQRYFGPLSKYLAWLINDLDLGRDIAQNILVKIYQNPKLFDPSKNFKTWLFSIAKNQWKNEIRNKITRDRHSKQWIGSEDAPEINLDEQQYRLQLIRKGIKELSEQHREVFILKYSNNLTIKEISTICNCSEGTVKSRLFYALKSLKSTVSTSIKKEV